MTKTAYQICNRCVMDTSDPEIVFDEKGKRHTPREWFIAPMEVIEQAIELIINGKITCSRLIS